MTRLVLKLETRLGVYQQHHTLAHVAAKGVGWCILSESPRRGWHSTYSDCTAAKAAFDAMTLPVLEATQ